MTGIKAIHSHNLERVRPGQTKISLEAGATEVTYTAKPKDLKNIRPFKALEPLTMKMLADAVNHGHLKR